MQDTQQACLSRPHERKEPICEEGDASRFKITVETILHRMLRSPLTSRESTPKVF